MTPYQKRLLISAIGVVVLIGAAFPLGIKRGWVAALYIAIFMAWVFGSMEWAKRAQ